jgi:CubicO group peptidase (beta-lactamase class C family)
MALSSPVPQSSPDRSHRLLTVDDGWTTVAPGDAGMDAGPLERLTEAIRRYPDWNIHALLVEHAGRLVYEEYFAGEDNRWGQKLGYVTFDRQTRHDLRSVTKSVVAALVGTAVASEAIPSIDQPVVDVFPECGDLATPESRRITLRHALTMSAGLQWNEECPTRIRATTGLA